MCRVSESPTLIDLFAGCGGMTAGFVRHGYTPVFAVEHNERKLATSTSRASVLLTSRRVTPGQPACRALH